MDFGDFFWLMIWSFFFVCYLMILFQIASVISSVIKSSADGGRRSGLLPWSLFPSSAR